MPRTNPRKQKTPVKHGWMTKRNDVRIVRGRRPSRPALGSSRPVIFTRNLSSNAFFPDKFATVVCTSMQGFIGTANATLSLGNYMSVNVNSIFQPFNTAYPMTGNIALNPSFHATLNQGFFINDSPIGYTLLASLYNNYRVMNYELEITTQPQATNDVVRACMIPLGADQIPSVALANINLNVLESQPYTIATTCVANSPSTSNTLTIKGDVWRDLGLSYAQYYAGTNPVTGPPSSALSDYVGYYLQAMSSNNAQPVAVTAKLRQYIIFSDLKGAVI